MGITQLSLTRIERRIHPDDNILILGCQNIYSAENYGQIADDFYSMQGYTVRTIDITGCQGSEIMDLREDQSFAGEYTLILQHGTIEHCDGSLYQVLKNIHEACQVKGKMIHENPMTGNWPGHGYHFFTETFWEELADKCDYLMFEIGQEPAMGNTADGWNVYTVMQRLTDREFIDEDEFNQIYEQHIFSK